MADPNALTVAQAAQIANVTQRTIQRWISDGWLKTTRRSRQHRIRWVDIGEAQAEARAHRLGIIKRQAA